MRQLLKNAVRTITVFAAMWPCPWFHAHSQSTAPAGIEMVDVPLVAWVASRERALPNTLANFSSEAARLTTFRSFADALATRDWSTAQRLARGLSYELASIREADTWFVIASDDSRSGRDPTIVINTAPRKDVVFQAPHVPFEKGTAEQAIVLLRHLGGRAAIISGAHRCASKTFTTCDGRTEVCGSLQAYRDSDVGHNTGTPFHIAHVAFAERWNRSIAVSLHGMKEDSDGVRTSIILSNGARNPDNTQQSAATRLRQLLAPAFSYGGAVVSCNLTADDAYNYRKLCGYTNVQGRHINGDTDACRDSVDQGSGRFIHVEQDWDVLRPFAHHWARLEQHQPTRSFMDALVAVLPPVSEP